MPNVLRCGIEFDMKNLLEKIGIIFDRKIRSWIIVFLFILFPTIQYFFPPNGLISKILLYMSITYFISLFLYTEFSLPRLEKSEVLYAEKTASGHPDLNILTKLGGAQGCLKLQLSKDYLIISSWFPFSLIAPIFDGVHVIKTSNIVSIENQKSWFSIKYRLLFKSDRSEDMYGFTIYPKKNQQFKEAFANFINNGR